MSEQACLCSPPLEGIASTTQQLTETKVPVLSEHQQMSKLTAESPLRTPVKVVQSLSDKPKETCAHLTSNDGAGSMVTSKLSNNGMKNNPIEEKSAGLQSGISSTCIGKGKRKFVDLLDPGRIRKPLYCVSCQCCLSNKETITCAECESVDLCLLCFSCGYETDVHKPSHSYQIMDNLDNVAVFNDNWTAHEELVLLDSIGKLGVGNWDDVAAKLPRRTASSCERHYMEQHVWGVCKVPRRVKSEAEEYSYKVIDANLKRAATNLASMPGATLAGYMPLRGDFDVEFMNDAEKDVKDIVFTGSETPDVRQAKMDVLLAYNKILDERKLRKEFILRRGLLNKCTGNSSSMDYVERNIRNVLRPYERHVKLGTYDELINGLLHQRRLALQLHILKLYRSKGLKTFSDIRTRISHDQELEKAKKLNARIGYKRQSSSSRRMPHATVDNTQDVAIKSVTSVQSPTIRNQIGTEAVPSLMRLATKPQNAACTTVGDSHDKQANIPRSVLPQESFQVTLHAENREQSSAPISTDSMHHSSTTGATPQPALMSLSINSEQGSLARSDSSLQPVTQSVPSHDAPLVSENDTNVVQYGQGCTESGVVPSANPMLQQQNSHSFPGQLLSNPPPDAPKQQAMNGLRQVQNEPNQANLKTATVHDARAVKKPTMNSYRQAQIESAPTISTAFVPVNGAQLSLHEMQLAAKLEISPKELLIIKRVLQMNLEKNGFLTHQQAHSLVRIDVRKFGPIYEFYCAAGTPVGTNANVAGNSSVQHSSPAV